MSSTGRRNSYRSFRYNIGCVGCRLLLLFDRLSSGVSFSVIAVVFGGLVYVRWFRSVGSLLASFEFVLMRLSLSCCQLRG